MPLFGTLGIAKQKGSGVAASGRHNDRTREILNADPSRQDQNRLLIGDERNVREIVTEVIDAHGGKPRRDSVEAVEMVLSATHAYFTDDKDEIDKEKLDRWVEQSIKFLEDPRSLGKCVKAVLHLDERTPHIHAHKVPIDDKGKLNCKHYIAHKKDLYALHDLYHEYMEPLGLERGRYRSFAKHTDVQKFYAAILEDHEVQIRRDKIPDPPRVRTKANTEKYKEEVIEAVLDEIKEPLRVVHHQAMLTRDETAKREAAEQRAAERMAAAEKITRQAMEQLRGWQVSHATLKEQKDVLERANNKLIGEVRDARSELHVKSITAGKLSERLRDIPLPDVMEKLGYGREQIDNTFVYRGAEGKIGLMVADNQLLDQHRQEICRTSVSLVLYMKNVNEGVETTRDQAIDILADHFGEKRALAAGLVDEEQTRISYFIDRREARERDTQDRMMPARTPEQTMTRDDLSDYSYSR